MVIFTSDNGGRYRRYDYREQADDTVADLAPLKVDKGSLYEGGVRVPLIAKHPPLSKPVPSAPSRRLPTTSIRSQHPTRNRRCLLKERIASSFLVYWLARFGCVAASRTWLIRSIRVRTDLSNRSISRRAWPACEYPLGTAGRESMIRHSEQSPASDSTLAKNCTENLMCRSV